MILNTAAKENGHRWTITTGMKHLLYEKSEAQGHGRLLNFTLSKLIRGRCASLYVNHLFLKAMIIIIILM